MSRSAIGKQRAVGGNTRRYMVGAQYRAALRGRTDLPLRRYGKGAKAGAEDKLFHHKDIVLLYCLAKIAHNHPKYTGQ